MPNPLPKQRLIPSIPLLSNPSKLLQFLLGKLALQPLTQKLTQVEPLDLVPRAKEVGAAQQRDGVDAVERFVDCVQLLGCEADADGGDWIQVRENFEEDFAVESREC